MSPMRQIQGAHATHAFQARLAAALECREGDFAAFIRSIETDPLFQKLAAGTNPSSHVIHRVRRSFSGDKGSGVELKEEFTPEAGNSGEVEKLLEDREEITEIIRRIGEDKFRTYFLDRVGGFSTLEAAKACGLTVAGARALEDLVNSLGILESFHTAATDGAPSAAARPPDEPVACVVRLREGGYQIVFRSTCWNLGFYEIDHEKLRRLKEGDEFSPTDSARLGPLLRDIEIANRRKSTLFRVIEQIVENRRPFFDSDGKTASGPWRQNSLAKALEVHPSVVSRAVDGRSLETPWGEKMALKSFFDGGGARVRDALDMILEEESADLKKGVRRLPLADREIARKLSVLVGRRFASNTIAKYRDLWDIPNSYRRKPK